MKITIRDIGFLAGAACASISLVILAGCGNGIETSTGVRTGVVQKISAKGLLCTTYEGELVQQSFRLKGGTANVWQFSATAAASKPLEDAAQTGAPVALHYAQRSFASPCAGNTGYIVDKVTPLQGAQQ